MYNVYKHDKLEQLKAKQRKDELQIKEKEKRHKRT